MERMLSTLAMGSLLLLSALAVGWDLRERRIPNALTVGGALIALSLRGLQGGEPLLAGLGGLGLGFLAGLPLFLVGGFGGGDVKMLAAVGAFLGPSQFLVALLATALAGGALAVAVAARRGALTDMLRDTGGLAARLIGFRRGAPLKTLATPGALAIPYAVPIAVGAVCGVLA